MTFSPLIRIALALWLVLSSALAQVPHTLQHTLPVVTLNNPCPATIDYSG